MKNSIRISFGLSLIAVMLASPFYSAQAASQKYGIDTATGAKRILTAADLPARWQDYKATTIIYETSSEAKLSIPKLGFIPSRIDANTFVIQGDTVPGAEVTAVGGPFDLQPVLSNASGHFSIEVPLFQNQVTQYSLKVSKNEDGGPAATAFSPTLMIYLLEAEGAMQAVPRGPREGSDPAIDTPAPEGDSNPVASSDPAIDTPRPESASARFKDVPQGEWFHGAVERLASEGVVSGYQDGTFGPGDPVTRGQIVKILVKASGKASQLDVTFDPGFSDINEENPFWAYIGLAKKLGWISGYEDGRFAPDNIVTRAEAAKIMVKAFDLTTFPFETPRFPDVSSGIWFHPYVQTLAHLEVVKGNERGFFKPNDALNRAEVAKMTTKLMDIKQ